MDGKKNQIIQTKSLDRLSDILGFIMFVEWMLLVHYYWKNLFVRGLTFAAFGFSGLMIGIYLFRKAPKWAEGRRKKLVMLRLKRSYLFARRNFMYAFFVTLFVSIVWGDPAVKPRGVVQDQDFRDDKVFYDKLTLHKRDLNSEKKLFKKAWKNWDTLSGSQKREILERVIDVEATNLDLDYSVTLVIQDMDDAIQGRYRDYEVQIPKKNFETDSFMRLVEDIAHEMYHSFQQREIDAYEKNSIGKEQGKKTGEASFLYSSEGRQVIKKWKKEFENYQDGTDGEDAMTKYYYQDVEITARAYSERRVVQYRKKIKN